MISNWPSMGEGTEHPTCCWAFFHSSAPQEFLQCLIALLSPHPAPRPPQTATTCPWGPSGELSAQCLCSSSLFFAWKGIICSTHSSCLTVHNPRNVTSEHRHHTCTQLVLNRSFFLNNSFQLLSTYLKETALSRALSTSVHFSCVLGEPIRIDMI